MARHIYFASGTAVALPELKVDGIKKLAEQGKQRTDPGNAVDTAVVAAQLGRQNVEQLGHRLSFSRAPGSNEVSTGCRVLILLSQNSTTSITAETVPNGVKALKIRGEQM